MQNSWGGIRTPLLTVLAIFIGLFLYTSIFGPIPFSVSSVTTNKTDLFQAEGIGKATAVPDTALLSLGVTKNATTVQAAQNQINQTTNAIISELKKLGVEEKDIKTTNYSIYPDYDYSVPTSGQPRIRGYNASQNIEVRIKPIEKANQAMDAATAQGANAVGGVTFVLDDEVKKQLENKAREEAVKNAKEKAESLAKIAGIKLGKIVDVQESSTPQVFPTYQGAITSEKAVEQQTELQPGENNVQITITLSYQTF